jgi:5S rRNA maturation endonuclease (ribonuclease M5)
MNAADVLNKLRGVKRSGDGWTAKCPAHADDHNSLSVREDKHVLLYCHAGCSFEAIRAALGINNNGVRTIVATYDYRDETGRLLYQSIRYEPKGFIQRQPDGTGWKYKLNGVRRVPYRLIDLLSSESSKQVFIVEGEKDVDRLFSIGLVATTNAGGAGKWRDEYGEFLHARHVVIIPDNDEPGQKHAQQIARSLSGNAASIRILSLTKLPPKGDVSDWLDVGGTAEDLLRLADSTPEYLSDKQIDEASLQIVRMADVEPETVRWLWHPYIALGKLTILEGDPGLGKSWLTCALAAAVSQGRKIPGVGEFETGSVLMLSAEDGLADTLRPRLDAVGADVSRVLALNESLTFDTPGLLKLEATIIEHKPVLVIIDPLFAFTGGKVDIHRANECRAISAPLAAIAERQGCALLAVRHLGKSRGGGHALNAGIGSIDFAAAARSVLLVGQDPDETATRAIVQIKNNLAPHGQAIGYTLEGGAFYWTGASDLTAGRILALPSHEDERGTITEAVDFLQAALSTGGRDCKAIKDEAKQASISEATLRRAKVRLNVRAKKIGMPGTNFQKWVWELPDGEAAQVPDQYAQGSEVEHLRASETSKSDYDNNLAEDDQTNVLENLPRSDERLRIGEAITDDLYIPASTPNDVDSIARCIAESKSKHVDGHLLGQKAAS